MKKFIGIMVIVNFIFFACTETSENNSSKQIVAKIAKKEVNNRAKATKTVIDDSNNTITLTNKTVDNERIDGGTVYVTYCSNCHGYDGRLGLSGATDLTKSKLNFKQTVKRIKKGKGTMMAYQGVLSDAKIEAVAKYVLKFHK